MNLVDSSGWIEYLQDTPRADLFADAIEDRNALLVPTIALFEVHKVLNRRLPYELVERCLNVMRLGRVLDFTDARAIVGELERYDPELAAKPRWLVLNKLDMVPAEEREARVKDFIKRMRYKGPVFQISALTREGCEPLIKEIYKHIRAQQIIEQGIVDIDPRFKEQDKPQEPDADDPRFKALPSE